MRYRKKWRLPLLLLLLILVIAFFSIKAVVQEYPLDYTSVFNIHHTADESRGWNLILVNRDNYIPKNYEVELTTLSNGEQVDSRIYPDLQAMFDDARAAGLQLFVRDGYRTQEEQQEILDEKIEAYRNEGYSRNEAEKLAKEWVAIPGTSEHQLGLAVDINADTSLPLYCKKSSAGCSARETGRSIVMAKFVTAQEAVQAIHSGDRVALAHSVGEPQALVNAMLDNCQAYQNVEICHMLALGPCKYTQPEMAGHFWHNSLFAGPGSRKAVNQGRADYTPNLFGESPRLFMEGYLPIDVALITLSPPDERGYCSYGVTVDYTKCITECAKLVIAQINRHMPRTYGDTLVHIDDIDLAVECDEPLFQRPILPVGPIEEQIGRYCASLIEDGSVIQLGIGSIPDAILHFLGDKNDLGVHSEMLCDGALGLLKAGNINNSRKQINKGVSVVTYLYGQKELYEYAHLNPKLQIFPVNYVNDPRVIGQNDHVVSVNSALSVDLIGQVAADSLSADQIFSGAGGFVDFVRGASFSKGGKSIVAMPSTAMGGKISRIVEQFDAGRPVTLSRFETHYVVTEYGIAQLRGKTLQPEHSSRFLIQTSKMN